MSRPRPSFVIGFDRLEDRSLPSTVGTPWADPNHLTLSFVADGTQTPTGPSGLFAELAPTGTASAWQTEILRAFQTWAVNANINIGLVADGGQALGTAGAVQGDARFGDVRVAAAPLTSTQIASASPFSWLGSTYAGDVVLNTAMKFTRGATGGNAYNLFSVALHEAGHVFGLGHEGGDTVMNAGYVYSTGLTADEIADLRALYGARAADAYDLKAANGTLATASGLTKDATGRYTADADLTAAGDVDVYSFKAASATAAVTLQAKGLSLLQSRVSVYDATGKFLAGGAAANVLNNDVTLQLSGLTAGATYFVKVEAATSDVFGIGAYRLTANVGTDKTVKPVKEPPVADAHTNDTRATATGLTSVMARAPDARFDATYRGSIEDAADTDFYRLTVPGGGTGAVNLSVMVWATDGALDPRVRVYDAKGNAVAFRVLANDDGLMSVVVANATRGGVYYVQVSGKAGGATGGYVLAADFSPSAAPAPREIDNGQVGPLAPRATDTMTVVGGLYQFALYADPVSVGAGGVTLTVTDRTGRVMFTLDAAAGDPAVTRAVYLTAGTYKLTYTYRAASGSLPAAVRYHLGAHELSEGVGTYPPLGSTTTTDSTATTSTNVSLFAAPSAVDDAATFYDASSVSWGLAPTIDFFLSPLDTGESTTAYTAPSDGGWFGSWYFF